MTERARGRFSPSKLSRRIHDLSPDTIWFTAGMLMLITLCGLYDLGRLPILVLIIGLGFGFYRYRRGRGHYKLVKLFAAILIVINGYRVIGPRTPDEYPVIFSGVEVPGSVNFLGTMVEGRFDHIAVEGNGASFMAGTAAELEEALEATADAHKRWDALTPLSIGVTAMTRFRPWTETERQFFIRLNIVPEVWDAFNYIEIPDEELLDDEPLPDGTMLSAEDKRRYKRKALLLLQRRDVNRLYAKRTRQVYVISAKRPISWGSSLKASKDVSLTDIKSSAILKLANQVVEDLEHLGVVEPRYLNLSGIYDFFAEGWMVGQDFVNYHKQREHGNIPISDKQMEIKDGRIINNDCFWFDEQPEVRNGHIRFGRNYHRVFQLTNISPLLRAHTMSHLKRLGLTGSMATVGTTMSSDKEASYNVRAIAIRKQIEESKSKKVYHKPEEKLAIQELLDREDARFASGNTAMGYNCYIAVGAESEEVLDLLEEQLDTKVRLTPGAKMARIDGIAYQEDAFITAVLGVNRL